MVQQLLEALNSGIQGAMSASPQGLAIVQGLRHAAQQQAQLDEQKRQFDAEQQMKQQQAQRSQGQQSFGNLLQLLQSGAQPVQQGPSGTTMNMPAIQGGGQGIPNIPSAPGQVDPGRVVTPPGQQQGYYIPTLDQQAQQDASRKATAARASGGLIPLPTDLQGLYSPGQAPGEVSPTSARALHEVYRDTNDRQDSANAKGQPKPKTSITLTDKDAEVLGGKAGDEMPIDEYKARGGLHVEVARAKQADASARRADALASRNGSGGDQKPMTHAQAIAITSKKKAALDASNAQLERDLKESKTPGIGADADAIRQAYVDHAKRMVEAEKTYGEEINAAGGSYTPNPWAENELSALQAHNKASTAAAAPTAPAAAPATQQPKSTAPAAAAAPQHKVGDVVTYQGKPHKVASVTSDGKLVLTPQ